MWAFKGKKSGEKLAFRTPGLKYEATRATGVGACHIGYPNSSSMSYKTCRLHDAVTCTARSTCKRQFTRSIAHANWIVLSRSLCMSGVVTGHTVNKHFGDPEIKHKKSGYYEVSI